MKRAQVQMGETIFVIIILTILVTLGIVVASRAQEETYEQKKQEFQELDAITLSKYATSLAELQCSSLEVKDLSCFDKDKISAFIRLRESHPQLTAEYYFSQFGKARVEIYELYPQTQNWTIYYSELNQGAHPLAIKTIVPITLEDSITQQRSFALLSIELLTR